MSIASAQAQMNSAQAPHLTVDSTVGELLDNAAAQAILARQVPAIVNSPQMNQARGLSLRALQTYAPSLLTDARLDAINQELASSPEALASANAPHPAPAPADFHAAFELRVIPLWEGAAPGAHGDGPLDRPTLTLIGTDGAVANGSAVIVAPGGGYQGLATGHEGRQVGDWFAAHGVTAFVLTYRLVSGGYKHPTQLHDGQRAVRWVRSHAAEFGIDSNRIGMIGFSAGGHLTAMVSTEFDSGDANAVDPVDRVSSRPDFAALIYPAILLSGERNSFFGLVDGKPDKRTLRELLPAGNVTAQTPPTFIVHTTADELVAPANSIAYYNALYAAHVPVEMHIFAQGRHGLGLGMSETLMGEWPNLLWNWLNACGFLTSNSVTCMARTGPTPTL